MTVSKKMHSIICFIYACIFVCNCALHPNDNSNNQESFSDPFNIDRDHSDYLNNNIGTHSILKRSKFNQNFYTPLDHTITPTLKHDSISDKVKLLSFFYELNDNEKFDETLLDKMNRRKKRSVREFINAEVPWPDMITTVNALDAASHSDTGIYTKNSKFFKTEIPLNVLTNEADESATTPAEEPATTPIEEPATTPIEEPATTPAEEPATTPIEEPATTPIEEPATTPIEEPATTPIEEPATTPIEEPATTPIEEPATTPIEEPATTPIEEPTTTPTEEPTTTPTEEPTTTTTEETTTTTTEETTTTTTEETTTTTSEEPTTTPTEESATTPTEKPMTNTTKYPLTTRENTNTVTSNISISPTMDDSNYYSIIEQIIGLGYEMSATPNPSITTWERWQGRLKDIVDREWSPMVRYQRLHVSSEALSLIDRLLKIYQDRKMNFPGGINRLFSLIKSLLNRSIDGWIFEIEPSKKFPSATSFEYINYQYSENTDLMISKHVFLSFPEYFTVEMYILPQMVVSTIFITNITTFMEPFFGANSSYFPLIFYNNFTNSFNLDLKPKPVFRFFNVSQKVEHTKLLKVYEHFSIGDTTGTFIPDRTNSSSISNNDTLEIEWNHNLKAFTIVKTNETTPEEIVQETDDKIENINQNLTSNITEDEFHDALTQTQNILENAVDPEVIASMTPEVSKKISTNSFNIVNNLLSQNNIWNDFSSESKIESSDKIFKIIHLVATIMNAKVEDEYVYENETFTAKSKQFNLDKDVAINFDIQNNSYPIDVHVPFSSLNPKYFSNSSEDVSATFAVILQPPTKDFLNFNDKKINAHIFALVLSNNTVLVDKFVYRIHHYEKLEFGDASKCSFWTDLNWSEHGCRLKELESNRKLSICECNHTSNFAVIMDVSHREIPSKTKAIMTYICSSITIVSASIAMFLSAKYYDAPKSIEEDLHRFKKNKFFITQNICVWLIVSHLIIIFGMDQTEYPFVCISSSILLFFSLLCTFTFILMMSILLFRSTSQTKLFHLITPRQFSFMSYTLPITIIIISIAIILSAETDNLMDAVCGEYFCWIASKKYPQNILFFVVPVTIITIINFILMGIISARIICKYQKNRIGKTLFALAILSLSFGLPWILYIFYINRYFTSFAYVFIIVNGCQGLGLFAEQIMRYRVRLLRDYPRLRKIQFLGMNSSKFSKSSLNGAQNSNQSSNLTNLSDD